MNATTFGALVGAAIDGADGEDGVADGALIGAVVANVTKVVVPLAIVGGLGYYAWRKAGQFKQRWTARREARA
jgi:hypothetical protein